MQAQKIEALGPLFLPQWMVALPADEQLFGFLGPALVYQAQDLFHPRPGPSRPGRHPEQNHHQPDDYPQTLPHQGHQKVFALSGSSTYFRPSIQTQGPSSILAGSPRSRSTVSRVPRIRPCFS